MKLRELKNLMKLIKKKLSQLEKLDTIGGINFDSVIIADFEEPLKSVATSLIYTDIPH